MAIGAPQGRTHLSAEALWRVVRPGVATLPDQRGGAAELACPDVLRSAFAMFSLPSPSRLALDQPRAEGHVRTIDGLARVPCDTPMRERLEPVSPEFLPPVCTRVVRQRQRGKAREPMVCRDAPDWLCRDGTGDVAAKRMHCASCLHQTPRQGRVTYAHQMWGAALVPPDVRAVRPLLPAPIVKHDGTDHKAGERHAATRFMTKWRQDHPPLQCIVTDESLSAQAPPLATRHAHQLHDMLGGKDGEQALLCHQVQGAEQAGRVTADTRHDRTAGLVPRVRLVHDVPRKASHAGGRVHVMADGERGQDKVPHGSWVTDVRVHQRHGCRLLRGGRARWKIEPEPLHPLKHPGDHCEPHDGQGQQPLAGGLALRMRLAFWVDQPQQRCGAWLHTVWANRGRPRLLGERLRALGDDDALASMRPRLAAVFDGLEKPHPSCAWDAASSHHRCLRRPRAIAAGDPPSSWGIYAAITR